jgi:hypothetical protein
MYSNFAKILIFIASTLISFGTVNSISTEIVGLFTKFQWNIFILILMASIVAIVAIVPYLLALFNKSTREFSYVSLAFSTIAILTHGTFPSFSKSILYISASIIGLSMFLLYENYIVKLTRQVTPPRSSDPD